MENTNPNYLGQMTYQGQSPEGLAVYAEPAREAAASTASVPARLVPSQTATPQELDDFALTPVRAPEPQEAA